MMTASRSRYLTWLLVAGITLAALALRLWGIRQSLPYVEQPDEPNPINYVVEMLRTGDPNQQFFQKPSLYIYLLLAVLQIHYAWGSANGLYGPISEMLITTHLVTTIPEFFFWARILSATIGAITVATAYAFAARAWGRSAGLAAALFVATLPYHLRFSQFVTTDVTAAWLVLLCLHSCILIIRENRLRAYLVAGAFAGLAASTKYNAGVVALAIVAAALLHMLDERRRTKDEGRNRTGSFWSFVLRLSSAALAALATFIAGTPYALLRWDQVGGGVLRQWGNYDGNSGHYRGAWNVAGYLDFFWNTGLGPLAFVVVLAGLAFMLRRDRSLALLWLSFALPSLLLHLSRPTHFMQNMLPLLVLCSLPFGVAVAETSRLLATRAQGLGVSSAERDKGTRGKTAPTPLPASANHRLTWSPAHRLAAALTIALLIPTTLTSLARASELSSGDTRSQLIAWLDANVPPGTRIAAEIKPPPVTTEARWVDFPRLDMHDLAWYRQQGYAYLVASSKRWGSMLLPASYSELTSGGQLAEFGTTEATSTLGPRLLVWSTGLSAADVRLQPPGELRIGGARLLGLNMGRVGEKGILEPAETLQPGQALALRSFWLVEEPFPDDLFVFVHLLDAAGNRVAQRDTPPWQGRFPTTSWQPGTMVVDVNDLYLPPTLAPGDYRLVVGMYNPATFARPLTTLNSAPLPDAMAELATITITQ
jgi:4-amino-4-deoxy-L-arabinose transferase-like glycosyltransferase